uniref:Uncharacterized protein n=1 Tax=Ixodes ricinus TaxID=34613 RepID=A0A6B0URC8_IXORI
MCSILRRCPLIPSFLTIASCRAVIVSGGLHVLSDDRRSFATFVLRRARAQSKLPRRRCTSVGRLLRLAWRAQDGMANEWSSTAVSLPLSLSCSARALRRNSLVTVSVQPLWNALWGLLAFSLLCVAYITR